MVLSRRGMGIFVFRQVQTDFPLGAEEIQPGL